MVTMAAPASADSGEASLPAGSLSYLSWKEVRLARLPHVPGPP